MAKYAAQAAAAATSAPAAEATPAAPAMPPVPETAPVRGDSGDVAKKLEARDDVSVRPSERPFQELDTGVAPNLDVPEAPEEVKRIFDDERREGDDEDAAHRRAAFVDDVGAAQASFQDGQRSEESLPAKQPSDGVPDARATATTTTKSHAPSRIPRMRSGVAPGAAETAVATAPESTSAPAVEAASLASPVDAKATPAVEAPTAVGAKPPAPAPIPAAAAAPAAARSAAAASATATPAATAQTSIPGAAQNVAPGPTVATATVAAAAAAAAPAAAPPDARAAAPPVKPADPKSTATATAATDPVAKPPAAAADAVATPPPIRPHATPAKTPLTLAAASPITSVADAVQRASALHKQPSVADPEDAKVLSPASKFGSTHHLIMATENAEQIGEESVPHVVESTTIEPTADFRILAAYHLGEDGDKEAAAARQQGGEGLAEFIPAITEQQLAQNDQNQAKVVFLRLEIYESVNYVSVTIWPNK